MEKPAQTDGPIRPILPLGPPLKDAPRELGSMKWHEFTAAADGQVPIPNLTRAWSALNKVNLRYERQKKWPHPEVTASRSHPELLEQPFMVRKFPRADSVVDLDALYVVLRTGLLERGGEGMGRSTLGLISELVNLQIEAQQ